LFGVINRSRHVFQLLLDLTEALHGLVEMLRPAGLSRLLRGVQVALALGKTPGGVMQPLHQIFGRPEVCDGDVLRRLGLHGELHR
jgi:hypothetical protein